MLIPNPKKSTGHVMHLLMQGPVTSEQWYEITDDPELHLVIQKLEQNFNVGIEQRRLKVRGGHVTEYKLDQKSKGAINRMPVRWFKTACQGLYGE